MERGMIAWMLTELLVQLVDDPAWCAEQSS